MEVLFKHLCFWDQLRPLCTFKHAMKERERVTAEQILVPNGNTTTTHYVAWNENKTFDLAADYQALL